MQKKSANLGFMLANGGTPDLISKQDSDRIRKFEGLPPSDGGEKDQTLKNWVDRVIEIDRSISPEACEEYRKTMNTIAKDLGEQLPFPTSSNVYSCKEDSSHKSKRGISFSDAASFVINNGVLERYIGIDKSIALIPHGVRVIGEEAFDSFNAETIITIVLPETIERIENYAFCRCSSLKYINLPVSLRSIGAYSFPTDALRDLYIPDSVQKCGSLGDIVLNTLRMPLHLFNETDCIHRAKIKQLIIGLPPEDGSTPSQDMVSLEKLKEINHKPAITFEPYTSSHSWDIANHLTNSLYTVYGCVINSECTFGRAYLPEDEDDVIEYTFVISIPKKALAIPSCADVIDYRSGWYHDAPVLYISPSIEYIAPDAFRAKSEKNFVTPASNEQNLRNILSKAKFPYQIITI